ncbi:7180_t:CDS:2 [Ambispora leptoticha]|uniref:7180_t:CDS:1 n=1 Tax=Ambispora leptoticha TaxID=144679 RepID=A0A9N8YXT5_9GLOM|nr:7180_t:CDS:2 [Ambispora leptoticha]
MPQELNSVIQPCNNLTPEVGENVDLGSLKCPTSDAVIYDQKRVAGGNRSHKKKGMDELKHELFNPPLESDTMPELEKLYSSHFTPSLKDPLYHKNNHSVTVFSNTDTLNPSHPTHTKFTTWHKPVCHLIPAPLKCRKYSIS